MVVRHISAAQVPKQSDYLSCRPFGLNGQAGPVLFVIEPSRQPEELMRTPSRNTLHLPRLTQNISKRNARHLRACR